MSAVGGWELEVGVMARRCAKDLGWRKLPSAIFWGQNARPPPDKNKWMYLGKLIKLVSEPSLLVWEGAFFSRTLLFLGFGEHRACQKIPLPHTLKQRQCDSETWIFQSEFSSQRRLIRKQMDSDNRKGSS